MDISKEHLSDLIRDQLKEVENEIKIKNSRTCRECPAFILPYIYNVDRRGRRLPESEQIGTCRMNMACGIIRGTYGPPYPDICEGPNGRKYLVTWNQIQGKDIVKYEGES